MDIDQEEAGLERAEFYPVEVKYDEDADVDESEENDDLHNMSQEWIIVSSHLSVCPSVCLCERLQSCVGSIYLSVCTYRIQCVICLFVHLSVYVTDWKEMVEAFTCLCIYIYVTECNLSSNL